MVFWLVKVLFLFSAGRILRIVLVKCSWSPWNLPLGKGKPFIYRPPICGFHVSFRMFPTIRIFPNHPWINRVFHYVHHPFWGPTPILGKPPICEGGGRTQFSFQQGAAVFFFRRNGMLAEVVSFLHNRCQSARCHPPPTIQFQLNSSKRMKWIFLEQKTAFWTASSFLISESATERVGVSSNTPRRHENVRR